MTDQIWVRFAETEEVGWRLRSESEQIQQLLAASQNTYHTLFDAGLRGAFSDDLEARWQQIAALWNALHESLFETGTDLMTVVAWFRRLDAECAAAFTASQVVPVAAGGAVASADRLNTVRQAIGALGSIRDNMQQQLAFQNEQLTNPFYSVLNQLAGVRDDYQQMHDATETRIQEINQKLAELDAERVQLESAPPVPVTPVSTFGDLIQPPVEPPIVSPPASTLMGRPIEMSQYAHQQNRKEYTCALFAQASVMQAMGVDLKLDTEIANAVQTGQKEGWYSPTQGTSGLGQRLSAHGIPADTFYTEASPNNTPAQAEANREQAFSRLETELQQGHYPIVSVNAKYLQTVTSLDDGAAQTYKGTGVQGHAVWITGLRSDDQGNVTGVIANDSFWGESVEYPVDQFMNAWGSNPPPTVNYYSVFARQP